MKPVGIKKHQFTRNDRLKGRAEIGVVFARGRKVSCPGAKLFYIDNGLEVTRIAFTFARNYGNAVERNHSRRLSREAYRLMKMRPRKGLDLVLLVYPDGDSYAFRVHQLEVLFSKAGFCSEVK
jgi:ribonuclease P protein component